MNKVKIIFSIAFAFFGMLLFIFMAAGCGKVESGGGGDLSGIQPIKFYNETSNVAPVFIPSARIKAAATWESGNTLYELFYALREYIHTSDSGIVDRANIYRLLYDVENLFGSMTAEVVSLSTPKVIVPPFNFGNNITYEAAVNDSKNERSAAMISSGNTTRGIVAWIWRDAGNPNKREVGVLEVAMNNASKDISVDFIFSVDYDASDTICDYNNRTKISGNSNTHAFEFVQTISGSNEASKLVQIVGKGISKGTGNNFLFKIKSNYNDGFNSPLYLVVSAEANENTIKNINISNEAYADPSLLPASVAAYKNYVANTSFFAFTGLLTDLKELNKGNVKEGTIYLDY